jgi:hypothetical protein
MHMIQNACNPKIQRCLYIMLHMPCQMQEMQKGKLYICYKGAPTHKAHKRLTPRGEAKWARHHRQKSKEAQKPQALAKHMH